MDATKMQECSLEDRDPEPSEMPPCSSSYTKKAKVLTEHDIKIAAILVQDAQAERSIKFKRDQKSLRAYQLYRHDVFKVALFTCIWGNMFLALFEKPGIYELPSWASMSLEFLFLSYFLFRFFHNYYFTANEKFWRDPKNITVAVSVSLISIDMMSYAIWSALGSGSPHPIRWSRVLRPLFMINLPEGRQVRKAFRSIRRTFVDIAHGLFLLLASIALFSLMALKLFEMKNLTYPNGRPFFKNYFEIFWDLYVLVTTANSPDIMMPAYNNNRLYAVFFICFLLVNLYIFTSIVLAIVFYNYKRHLKDEVRKAVYRKRKLLSNSFDILSEASASENGVTKECFYKLLRVAIPKRSDLYFSVIYSVLDPKNSGRIIKAEFLKLTDVLTIPLIESVDAINFFETAFPKCYGSAPSVFLRKVVKHRFFRLFFDLAICANTICIALNWDQAEWFFLTIFILEILTKMYTFGVMQFFNNNAWNSFDFVIVLSALVITVVEAAIGSVVKSEELSLDFILVFRVLRLVRLLDNSKTFRIIFKTIVNIGPSIATYGCVFFVIYYIFAIIGMEVFGGRIKEGASQWCGNSALNNSYFYRMEYCANNFNDLTRAFVTLFELMVVNQWHELANGFVLVTNKGARVYFFTFHVVGVVVLLNIITAFVLEAFMIEYTVSNRHHLKEALLQTVESLGLTKEQATASAVCDPNATNSATGTRKSQEEKIYFTLNDHGFKKTEVILQEMFEEQIDSTEQGPYQDNSDSDQEEDTHSIFDYMRM